MKRIIATAAAALTLASCTPGEALYAAFHPLGGNELVTEANRVAHRESRHNPTARNTRSSACGLMQILDRPHRARVARLGLTRRQVCTDPLANALVAADLYAECGWRPWTGPHYGCRAPGISIDR